MKCCMLFYLLYDRIFIVRLVGLASFRFRNSEATEKKSVFFSFFLPISVNGSTHRTQPGDISFFGT